MGVLWTCFGRQQDHPATLHCTHKYLGVQTEKKTQEILSKVEIYLLEGQGRQPLPEIMFGVVDYFGEDYKRVLVMSLMENKKHLFLSLRKQLDWYRPDDFPIWTPHITDELHYSIAAKFNRFFVMDGDSILRSYLI